MTERADFETSVNCFIERHKNALLALIHHDQEEQRLACNCAFCWPENPEHEVAR